MVKQKRLNIVSIHFVIVYIFIQNRLNVGRFYCNQKYKKLLRRIPSFIIYLHKIKSTINIWKSQQANLLIIMDKATYFFALFIICVNKTFFETTVLNDYSDPSLPEKNSYGNGTNDRLIEIQGKIYRDACMQIITLLPYGEYQYPENIDFKTSD